MSKLSKRNSMRCVKSFLFKSVDQFLLWNVLFWRPGSSLFGHNVQTFNHQIQFITNTSRLRGENIKIIITHCTDRVTFKYLKLINQYLIIIKYKHLWAGTRDEDAILGMWADLIINITNVFNVENLILEWKQWIHLKTLKH